MCLYVRMREKYQYISQKLKGQNSISQVYIVNSANVHGWREEQ